MAQGTATLHPSLDHWLRTARVRRILAFVILQGQVTLAIADSILPLNLNCDARSTQSSSVEHRCYKGDLISTAIADCKKTPVWKSTSCTPVGNSTNRIATTTTDVPDASVNGINCVPDTHKPLVCGVAKDTRCVCDAPGPLHFNSLRRPYVFNNCRCQYWPKSDVRETRATVCRQYEHGRRSGVHVYTCCDNCHHHGHREDRSCDGETYQGGGTNRALCGRCGKRVRSERTSRHRYTFNCGGCEQQQACREQCSRQWFGLAQLVPGLRRKWAGCFRSCCLHANVDHKRNRGK